MRIRYDKAVNKYSTSEKEVQAAENEAQKTNSERQCTTAHTLSGVQNEVTAHRTLDMIIKDVIKLYNIQYFGKVSFNGCRKLLHELVELFSSRMSDALQKGLDVNVHLTNFRIAQQALNNLTSRDIPGISQRIVLTEMVIHIKLLADVYQNWKTF